MYAYLIIAAELLILYTVFWYVFLREPKPYKIKGNPWGRYDEADDYSDGNSHSVPCHHIDEQTSRKELRNFTPEFEKVTCPHVQPRNRCSHGFTTMKPVQKNTVTYGWVWTPSERKQSTASSILEYIQETVGRWSMRLQ